MFELVLDLIIWVFFCVVVLVVGFIDVIVGGGGMLIVLVLLIVGLLLYFILGINKFVVSFGLLIVSVIYFWKKLFNFWFWVVFILVIVLGVFVGILVVDYLSIEFLNKLLLVVIILVVCYSFFGSLSMIEYNELFEFDSKIKIK